MAVCVKCRAVHDGTYGSKYGSGKFCSSKCAHSRERTQSIKNRVSETLKKTKPKNPEVEKFCENCERKFLVPFRRRKSKKYCSEECVRTASKRFMKGGHARKMGLASAKVSYRRSKNEVLFSEMCEKEFRKENVRLNEPMFNGWDADVILEEFKIAVMWNGIWHYRKVKEGHSVKQVKNRDSIKVREIEKRGYLPYVIRDEGRENAKFVASEFDKLKSFIKKTFFLEKDLT